MIETNYQDGELLVKRGDETVKTFKFKDFVSAKQFQPINELRNKLVKLATGKDTKTTEEQAEISEEVLIFLVNWSSIDAVKQYAKSLPEIK